MLKVIASHNGQLATQTAYALLEQGASAVDACVEGVTRIEDDPNELTVGYGGLPNEEGIVELDAAVMDGATHRVGAVAGLRDIRHAARVAQQVMRQTNRVLLVGEGARQFALANGFVAEDLLTERARKMWLYWKRRRSQVDDWLTPDEDDQLDLQRWFERHFYADTTPPNSVPFDRSGTVHCAALDSAGQLAAVTSTSGHAFKLPGRVGDSPIAGAGLYVDRQWGSCGSIGHGEANLQNLTSFAVIELLRQGLSLREAGLETLRRIVERTPDHDRDGQGRPNFHLQLFLLKASGEHLGVSFWAGKNMAVSDQQGTRLEPCIPLFDERPSRPAR